MTLASVTPHRLITTQNTFMCVAMSQKARSSYIESLISNHVQPEVAANSDYGLLGVPHQKVMVAIVGRVYELHRKLLDESKSKQNQFNFKEAREFNLETLEPTYTSPESISFDAVFGSEEEEIRSPGKLYSWSYTGIKKYLKSRRNSLDYIADACSDLSKWKLEWGYREKGTTFNASASFLYELHEPEKGSSVFKFRLHAGLEKMAILNKNFTCIPIDQLRRFDRSSASLALYRICSRYAYNEVGEESHTPWYSPEQWKDLLFIPPNKYPSISKLKEKVLDRASKIINDMGELDVEYESEKKKGNKVTAVRFRIVRQESLFAKQTTESEHIPIPTEAEEKAQYIVGVLTGLGVSFPWIKKWIYNAEKKTTGDIYNALGVDELIYNVGYLKILSKEKSINGGYCTTTLKSKLDEFRAKTAQNYGSKTKEGGQPHPAQPQNNVANVEEDQTNKEAGTVYEYEGNQIIEREPASVFDLKAQQTNRSNRSTRSLSLEEEMNDTSWAD